MASVPVKPTPMETLEERFRRLAEVWDRDTMYLSSTTEIMAHPAMREIIQMGKPVVPLMLREMEQGHRHWVWALPEITGARPVPAEEAGNIPKMTQTWLRWARENGYQW